MLSQLEAQNVIHVPYQAVAPIGINDLLTLDFPTRNAYQIVALRSTITAAAAIVLPGLQIFDDTATFITSISIIPWQFSSTTITLMNLADEREISYQIVGEDEADIDLKKISCHSPIASALLGSEEGDEVVVKAPQGDISYEILEVQYI